MENDPNFGREPIERRQEIEEAQDAIELTLEELGNTDLSEERRGELEKELQAQRETLRRLETEE